MSNETIIEELNTFLRGTYMGIRAFEHYIQKVERPDLKRTFQDMQQEQKHHAEHIAARIQDLGGVPADNEGFTGSMTSFMHKMITPKNEQGILEDAIEGLDKYGVHYSKEIVKGDLDPASERIVDEIIHDNHRQAEQLRHLLH